MANQMIVVVILACISIADGMTCRAVEVMTARSGAGPNRDASAAEWCGNNARNVARQWMIENPEWNVKAVACNTAGEST